MSELQPLARGDIVGPAGAMPPADTPQQTDAPSRTFWQVVSRAYWRRALNIIASGWVALILLLTVIVPFLANDAPYSALVKHIADDETISWVNEYPLFHDLTRVDWIWLLWGAASLLYALLHLSTRYRPGRKLQPSRWRFRGALLIVGLATLGSLAIVSCKTDFLDVRDYHQLAADGSLQHALFPPLRWGYATQEPLQLARLFEEPSASHFLGTDGNGRDVFARLLWGARVVLEIGLVSEVISLVIGVLYGALMGYFVGKVDLLGMRFVEVVEAIPLLFLLITIVAVFGRQFFVLMVIIGVTGWTGIARFVRAEFFRIRQMDYVTAAKASGLPLRNILFRHMLPNGLTPVIVSFTFGVAGNIVSESILSFLGIGVEPPTASWGAMLADAGDPGVVFHWWLALAPGLMIFLTVFAYNIIGEGLRDAIDPKLNKLE